MYLMAVYCQALYSHLYSDCDFVLVTVLIFFLHMRQKKNQLIICIIALGHIRREGKSWGKYGFIMSSSITVGALMLIIVKPYYFKL